MGEDENNVGLVKNKNLDDFFLYYEYFTLLIEELLEVEFKFNRDDNSFRGDSTHKNLKIINQFCNYKI